MKTPLPSAVLLQRFIQGYGPCERCGILPQNVDHVETGDLCPEHREAWDELDPRDQAGLVVVGLAHVVWGLDADEDDVDPDGLRLVSKEPA